MKKRVRFSFRSGRFQTLSAQKLAVFCGQLGTMLSAGVGICPPCAPSPGANMPRICRISCTRWLKPSPGDTL